MPRPNPWIDYSRAVDGLGYVSPYPFFLGLPNAVEHDDHAEAPCPVCRRGRARMDRESRIAACDRGCSHGQLTRIAMLASPIMPRRKREANDYRSVAHRAMLELRRTAA